MRKFDFTAFFAIAIFGFIAVAIAQFSHSLGDAERGLVMYEQTCPLNAAPAVNE